MVGLVVDLVVGLVIGLVVDLTTNLVAGDDRGSTCPSGKLMPTFVTARNSSKSASATG